MALSAIEVKSAKPRDKQYKLFDERGLFLLVTPAGSKLWRLKYRFDGREKLLALGAFPEVSLADARTRRDEERTRLSSGIDPSAQRKAVRADRVAAVANSFQSVADEWLEKHRSEVKPSHSSKNARRLELYVFPLIGSTPIRDIQPPEVLGALRRIERRGHIETAHRVKTLIGQIFRYAVATGRVTRDVTADLKGALRTAKTRHHAAITDPVEVGALLRAIEGYSGYPATCCALRLAPLLMVRPGELRSARWDDFDLASGEWRVVAKGGHPLLVPLPPQAVAILKEMEPLSGTLDYVFPSTRDRRRPMSDNTINAALRRLGLDFPQYREHPGASF